MPGEVTAVVREKLIAAMERVFQGEKHYIEHTAAVLDFAQQIHHVEGGDPVIIEAAAILHDIGIPAAIEKHGSAAGPYQELEGPPIARSILEDAAVPPSVIETVCAIIGAHHSGDLDTREFRVVWDADWLVNFPDIHGNASRDAQAEAIDATFRTDAGKTLAHRLFLEAA